MATSSHNRAFQAYNSHNFKNRPAIKKNITSSTGEPLVFGRIPYSSIKTTVDKTPLMSTCSNPNSTVKPIPMTTKRGSSITSLSHLIPHHKSLQMTALASQRQSLWISIAKNAQTDNTQASSLPILGHPHANLTRKKLLRLLLVFSYLLSISLFAIALATFYGFFWSGYTTTQMSNVETSVSSLFSLIPNSTLIDTQLSIEGESVIKI
ncbi:unnamed protein product [Adineta steineri]|uniref:Uncharacterized protein n=1 Tax=Adineta steineri TaxID=433720 RepID=A0A818MR62_9BILA|nr:unnamed protein product [Adineta steineri]